MDQIKLLQRLGFTEYEARAYLSLAKLGPSAVREIVLDSKLPRNKAYEALQRLEEKRKVISLPVSPKKFKILDPDQLKEEVKDLTGSVNDLIKLVHQPKVKEFKDLFWILQGRKAIWEKLAMQNKKARKEILTCNGVPVPVPKNQRVLRETCERGVKVKMIVPAGASQKGIDYWKKTGAEIRLFNEKKYGPLLPRICIFDNEVARLTIGKPEVPKSEDYITIWTESKAFAQMLRNHFMNMWKNSLPVKGK
ncbi:TrmB family transcriptional regulator [Nanoarchaeota archaeon]